MSTRVRTICGRASLVVALVTGAAVVAPGASAGATSTVLATFSTPGAASYIVPSTVCGITVTVDGGHGGAGYDSSVPGPGGAGGAGAHVSAHFAITPGAWLLIMVGGPGGGATSAAPGVGGVGGGGGGGAGANNGGGGGGASLVASAVPLVVAGGGGGGGGNAATGAGNGAGQTGLRSVGAPVIDAGRAGQGGPGAGSGGGGGGLGGAVGSGPRPKLAPTGGAGGAFGGAGGTGDGARGGGGGGGGKDSGGAGDVGAAGTSTGTGVPGGSANGGAGGAGTWTGGNGGSAGNGAGGGGAGGNGFSGGGGGSSSGGGGGGAGLGGGGGGGAGVGGGGGGAIDAGGGAGSLSIGAGATNTSVGASARSAGGQVVISYDAIADICLVVAPVGHVPPIVHQGPTTRPLVALSIDDINGVAGAKDVNAVMDILAAKRVKGITFFPLGEALALQHASGYDWVWRRVARSGSEIGNHTYTHPNLTRLSNAQIRWELASTQAALNTVLGPGFAYRMHLMRPPGGNGGMGSGDPRLLSIVNSMGYSLVMWSIDAYNTAAHAPFVAKIIRQARPGSIVLMHFTGVTPAEVGQVIDGIRRKGLEPTTITGLFP